MIYHWKNLKEIAEFLDRHADDVVERSKKPDITKRERDLLRRESHALRFAAGLLRSSVIEPVREETKREAG
jgi:hypothetical protein